MKARAVACIAFLVPTVGTIAFARTAAFAQTAYDPIRQVLVPNTRAPSAPSSQIGGAVLASSTFLGVDVTPDNLLDIDPVTAAGTVVGLVGSPVVASVAWDRTSGLVYGTDTLTGDLVTIDPQTGATTVIGNTGLPLLHGAAVHPTTGVLYAASDNGSQCDLYTLNKLTAAPTLVGNLGFQHISALDFDPTTNVLYGAYAWSDSSGTLITIDLLTGAGTLVGSTHRLNGLAFDASGTLFGVHNNSSTTGPSELLAVDKNTGAWSPIGNIVNGNVLGATEFEILALTPFCFPGQSGIITCPCSNPPTASGKGCNNFGAGPADSAELAAAGSPSISNDTCTLTATGENNTSTTIFLQAPSTSSTGLVFGAGVRCISGSLKRLYTGQASGGSITRPQSGDPSIHVRSAALGDALAPGDVRYYMSYYRDPQASGPCSNAASTFNCSNSGRMTWQP